MSVLVKREDVVRSTGKLGDLRDAVDVGRVSRSVCTSSEAKDTFIFLDVY